MSRRREQERRAIALASAVILAIGLWLGGNEGLSSGRAWDVLTGSEGVSSRPNGTEELRYSAWDRSAAPNYYRVLGRASIGDRPSAGTASYASLDALGRACGVAACVDWHMMELGRSRERGDLSRLRPSGWGHNREVDIELPGGKTYHGAFWNRSHLLAKSLGGSDELENLVCGTRMQNVGSNDPTSPGGMAYCEDLARTWLESHPEGNVAYVVTPVYEGDELVCRSVIVDLLSSDGAIDQRVEVYNAAMGYAIDYSNGSFSAV